MILTIALVTALYTPAQPTVGDHVTITFEHPVTLDPSPAYEVVSGSGQRIVIRTFLPAPLPLGGVTAGIRFRNLVLPIKSVLRPDDDFKPAPLVPPHGLPANRLPAILIAVAALLAVAIWALIWKKRLHSVSTSPVAALPPPDAFRAAIAQAAGHKQPWAALADAARAYLAAHGIGRELTTAQTAAALPGLLGDSDDGSYASMIRDILRRGDLQKFSPWGAPPGDFDAIAHSALGLVEILDPPVVEEVAA